MKDAYDRKDAYLRKLFSKLSTEDVRLIRDLVVTCSTLSPDAYPQMLAFLDLILDERLG